MKTRTSLLIALGLASFSTLAQPPRMQAAPQQPADAPPHSGGMTQQPADGAQPGAAQSGSGASGTQSGAQSSGMQPPSSAGSLGAQSGPQSGMPIHPGSGTSGAPSDSRPGMPPQPGPEPSGAQPQPSRRAEPSPMSRLQPRTENGVTYLCGGVGQEEASYLKGEARNHDLMLTFAAHNGEYLADVNVAIDDAKGNPVLQTTCDGPMMLVDLPKGGAYRIHAEANGYALNRTVNVKPHAQKGRSLASSVLVWPAQVARPGGSPSDVSGGGGSGGAGNSGTGRERQ